MAEQKKALITGITGQDGSYLAELLLEKGYEVHGLVRRVASPSNDSRIARIRRLMNNPGLRLRPGDITIYETLLDAMREVQPTEVYHLAAQSFVAESFKDKRTVMRVNEEGTLNMLEALLKFCPEAKFYFAGSSEMFGKVRETPQTEKTPFHPRSPYGVSKVAGFEWTRNFREAEGLFACSGILFNHESPRRGEEFVTRKVTRTAARIAAGREGDLALGNLDARRDWGFAGDYVEAMWLMLQQERPDDYVVATGKNHTVRELVQNAFETTGMTLRWEGEGLEEKGIDGEGRVRVRIDPKFYRPAEVDELVGNSEKARRELGWQPRIGFHELVEMMVREDIEKTKLEK